MNDLTIQGLQEAQRANLRHIAALKPHDAFGRLVLRTTTDAERYAVSITHVITGALRASHRIAYSGLRGEVSLDPLAANPVTGQHTSIYGQAEHARGGTHAFYQRTVDERGYESVRVNESELARMFT
jgi:hypothetical protein